MSLHRVKVWWIKICMQHVNGRTGVNQYVTRFSHRGIKNSNFYTTAVKKYDKFIWLKNKILCNIKYPVKSMYNKQFLFFYLLNLLIYSACVEGKNEITKITTGKINNNTTQQILILYIFLLYIEVKRILNQPARFSTNI